VGEPDPHKGGHSIFSRSSGLPKPFHPYVPLRAVTIPSGFNSKRTSQAISPALGRAVPSLTNGFNSKRTSQAISPAGCFLIRNTNNVFQFQADFPSHFTNLIPSLHRGDIGVSIPSGLPKPFHLRCRMLQNVAFCWFQFQADFPSHFT